MDNVECTGEKRGSVRIFRSVSSSSTATRRAEELIPFLRKNDIP